LQIGKFNALPSIGGWGFTGLSPKARTLPMGEIRYRLFRGCLFGTEQKLPVLFY
jgi:hypothetical protein